MSISVHLWTIINSGFRALSRAKNFSPLQKRRPGPLSTQAPGCGKRQLCRTRSQRPLHIIYIHRPLNSNFPPTLSVHRVADRPPEAVRDAGPRPVQWAPDGPAERGLYPLLPQCFPALSSRTLRMSAFAVVVHSALLGVRTISAAMVSLTRPWALAAGVLALVFGLDVLHRLPPC